MKAYAIDEKRSSYFPLTSVINVAALRLQLTGLYLIKAHFFVNARQYTAVVKIQAGQFSYASAALRYSVIYTSCLVQGLVKHWIS